MSPASAAAHCTTWLTHTNYGYRPHSTTPVWTEYLATSTHYASVDCGCCDVLASTTVMAPGYGGHGPFQPFIGRTTASTALVVTRTVCNSPMSGCHIQPTPSPSTPPDDDGGDDDDDDDDGDDDSTTTSTVVAATTTATAPTTTATPVSTSTRKHSTHTPLLPATTASRNTGCTSTRSHYLSLLHGPRTLSGPPLLSSLATSLAAACLFVATAGLGGHGPAFLSQYHRHGYDAHHVDYVCVSEDPERL